MEVDDISDHHDVVMAENWKAVAAATWCRLLAETNFKSRSDLAVS
jgi:hypothetical protein